MELRTHQRYRSGVSGSKGPVVAAPLAPSALVMRDERQVRLRRRWFCPPVIRPRSGRAPLADHAMHNRMCATARTVAVVVAPVRCRIHAGVLS
jgi:hypothetical protein